MKEVLVKRLGLLALALPLLISLFLSASGSTAFAASRGTTPQQTIFWINDLGHIVRSWKGSASAAQVIERDELARLARLHAQQRQAQPTTSPSPNAFSPNINRVSDSQCASDHGTVFWKVWNNTSGSAGGVCFANAGTASGLNIFNVSVITTGNNEGNFVFHQNGGGSIHEPGDGLQYCKQEALFPATSDGFFDDVTLISITSPNDPCQ